ncbi:SHOCT domain-containing protein [Salimicrobium jeotgali]|uniref:SHOCT domain-containing protein n=1 Tax=Salimicrobium jeotgali TaxID=1230341 RepID=UPI000C8613DC|nr:SHOCT domain-containing protein [Salimicrobium jeotgali]
MQNVDHVKEQLKPLGKINLVMISDSVKQLAILLEEDEQILSSCISQKNELLTLTDSRLITTKQTVFKGDVYDIYENSTIKNVITNKKASYLLLTFSYEDSEASFKLNNDKKTSHFLETFPKYIEGEAIEPQNSNTTMSRSKTIETTEEKNEKLNVLHKVKNSWKKASEEAESKGAEKKEIKKEKKLIRQKEIEYWYGSNPTFNEKTAVDLNITSFQYAKSSLLYNEETVLYAIPAEHNKTKKRKGILIATSDRLLFIMAGSTEQSVDQFEYEKMEGIYIRTEKFTTSDVYIVYNSSEKNFEKITNGRELDYFISIVKDKINDTSRDTPEPQSNNHLPSTPITYNENKYTQLEKLGELKEKGVLTDKEFQMEKEKILNN